MICPASGSEKKKTQSKAISNFHKNSIRIYSSHTKCVHGTLRVSTQQSAYLILTDLVILSHDEGVTIFILLTVTTTCFIYLSTLVKPSLSSMRIMIVVLGFAMISSVLICLTTGLIRKRRRKMTFPVKYKSSRIFTSTDKLSLMANGLNIATVIRD